MEFLPNKKHHPWPTLHNKTLKLQNMVHCKCFEISVRIDRFYEERVNNVVSRNTIASAQI